jgi:pimeloyl-ACP methyl ester carboxylesterase
MTVTLSSVDQVSISFKDHGTGPTTLMFIHGLSGDRTNFDSQMSFFATSHRVVGIDLPGSGASGRNRTGWSMELFGRDVADVADLLGVDDVVLVGHSFGGDVTVEAARLLDERVRALVWVNSHKTLGDHMHNSDIEKWLAPFTTDFAAAMNDLTRRNFGPNADPDQVDAVATAAMAMDPGRTIGILNAWLYNEPALLQGLSEVSAPVFAINAGFKPSNEASLNAHGINLTVIDDVGHFIMLEDPDSFNRTLSNILTQVAGTPTNHA